MSANILSIDFAARESTIPVLGATIQLNFEVWGNSSSTSRIDPEPYLLGQKLLYSTKKTSYIYKVTTNILHPLHPHPLYLFRRVIIYPVITP